MRNPWRVLPLTGFLITALVACGTPPATTNVIDRPAEELLVQPVVQPAAGGKGDPNIVLVLTDDLSMNLLKHVPAVRTMQQQGTTFKNYFVNNSLCCPSRTSIMTGRYSHNTGIYTNGNPDGGYQAFRDKKLDQDTFATDLRKAGYRTAIMGKFLNDYQPGGTQSPSANQPAGWDEWALAASGYAGFNYNLNQNGQVVHYGRKPKDYLTDVISRRGQDFIRRSAAREQPFLLELSTFTPHKPYAPAPRHAGLFKKAKVPRVKSYDKANTNPSAWMRARKLTKAQKKLMDQQYRQRLRTLQSISDMIVDIKGQLRRSGVEDNTYIVFTSDNGYHMGEHALVSGKMTAFDTDIHVPLVVTGPGVPAGQEVPELTQSIDLRPTFADLAGAPRPKKADGRSLAPLWRGGSNSRQYVLVEHRGPLVDPNDPDREVFRSPNPPDYTAIRGKSWLYVEYVTGEREYYDHKKDPLEQRNVVNRLSQKKVRSLHRKLEAAEKCKRQAACLKAQSLT